MNIEKPLFALKCLLGAGWLAWQFYLVGHPFSPMIQQPVHVLLAMSLVLLWVPLKLPCRFGRTLPRLIDVGLLGLVLASAWYILSQEPRLSAHWETVDPVYDLDIVFCLIMVGVLLECVRRVVGWSLLGVILLFMAYGFLGRYLPAWLRFGGFSLPEFTEFASMTPNGIFGVTTVTSVLYVFYFIVFGAFYNAIGGSQLFIDIGLRLVGRSTGGAAKAAVVSSSLMGSVSGSAVANVAATGVFTIPLMKSSGFTPERAGAVEALASTGGQLMPPVMGVAAFVMADLLQVKYLSIALAGVIPAVAYYMALFFQVDLEARKTGRGTIRAEDAVVAEAIRPRLYLLLPPLLLLWLLCAGYSATTSAYYASLSCFVTAFLRRRSRLRPRQILDAILDAGKQAAIVAVPIAAIGVIVAVAVQSNLALKFSTRLMEISGGTLVGALIFVVIGCLVMGMGLPTVAAYIIGAVLFVPALKGLGIPELAAHFFVMYYCVLSMITPPVAIASYTAAGLAKADAMRTSLLAFRMSLAVFLIPFAFAFDDALLGRADWPVVALAVISLLISMGAWATALVGWCGVNLGTLERALLAALSLAVLLAPTAKPVWFVCVCALLSAAAWFFLCRFKKSIQ